MPTSCWVLGSSSGSSQFRFRSWQLSSGGPAFCSTTWAVATVRNPPSLPTPLTQGHQIISHCRCSVALRVTSPTRAPPLLRRQILLHFIDVFSGCNHVTKETLVLQRKLQVPPPFFYLVPIWSFFPKVPATKGTKGTKGSEKLGRSVSAYLAPEELFCLRRCWPRLRPAQGATPRAR